MFIRNYFLLFVLTISNYGSSLPQDGDRMIIFPGQPNPKATEIHKSRISKIQEVAAPRIPIQDFHCGSIYPLGIYNRYFNGESVPIYHLNTTAEKLASEGFEITVENMLDDAILYFTASNGSFAVSYSYDEPGQVVGFAGGVGGEPATKTRAFYMAQLGTRRKEKIIWLCDGVLINTEWILSAAHCFVTHGKEPDLVRLGDYDLNEPAGDILDPYGKFVKDYPMADVVLHPEFTLGNRYHDLALIRIPRKYPRYSSGINPACLPWDSLTNKNLIGEKLMLTGWGALQYGGPKTALLQQVELEGFPTSVCNDSYFALRDFRQRYPQGMDESTILCVGSQTEGKDACGGDSGAPVVYTEKHSFVIAGIVSGGFGCGLKEFPGLYIPISKPKYLQWIKDVAFKEYA